MPALSVPAIASQNTLLYLGTDTSPSVFSANIARLGNIKVVTKVAVVDVSNQESGARRKLATLIENGPLTADYFWEPEQAQDEQLFSLILQKPPVLRSWKLVWPDGATWLFAAYLTNFSPDAVIAGALKVAFELTIDGEITVSV